MPLRKRATRAPQEAAAATSPAKKNTSKRQKIVDFFRSRKRKAHGEPKIPVPSAQGAPRKALRDSKIGESSKPAVSSSSVDVARPDAETEQPANLPAPTPASEPPKEKAEVLSEKEVHALFSGAPQFGIYQTNDCPIPAVSYPWDSELLVKDASDSVQLAQPAFSAATLHKHLPLVQGPSAPGESYQRYDVGVLEVPSMLSAPGIEPGSIGLVHFLQLPRSDNLVTDLQQSQSSNEFLQAAKNKEDMQNNPKSLGIREVDMSMVHERLAEFGDLVEVFQDSPERMTILNNQSSGDLYANLFGKFLHPPKWDGSTDDPTGMKVQIDTLLRILRIKGVWFDFSLVEWRIRLGQVLWSERDDDGASHHHKIWSDRDILLLQICLSCELLLRLDAVSSMEVEEVKQQMLVTPSEFQGFLDGQTKKTNWDLILAQRFLENIVVVKENESTSVAQSPKPGLLSMLSRGDAQGSPKSGIILLPRHQARQLSGLLHFAETIQWPGIELVVKDLARKLGVPDANPDTEHHPLPSPYGRFTDPTSPSSISVYGTPLATPRSGTSIRDSYFGNIATPGAGRSRSNSRNMNMTMKVPLSTTLLAAADAAAGALNIGGWLSRSFLTGLILPGEPISHFLMSTLLENDKLAIAALGDSANLYGGFVYAGKSWWSKSSIVGRVLACLEGASECMGWISVPKLPDSEAQAEGWYAIRSSEIAAEQPARISVEEDLLERDSSLIPGGDKENVKAVDLTLPLDTTPPPIPSVAFTSWNLVPVSTDTDLPDDTDSTSPSEAGESHIASLTFTSVNRGICYTFSLKHDVQFVTSWPCTPPSSLPPQVLKRSGELSVSVSRSSSKRSVHSARAPTRRPSRRNSHGYEPLLSHPPDSTDLAPTRAHSPPPDEEEEDIANKVPTPQRSKPMMAHPLHTAYKYRIIPVTEILDPAFNFPGPTNTTTEPTPESSTPSKSSSPSNPDSQADKNKPVENIKSDEQPTTKTQSEILILDARAANELELLARAWCAEKGFHALVGRVGRTCLACCIREARGLGVRVVVRV
ncbi:hypothetical protein BCR34DRAFT_607157 [Clohesyomyces aquaticus]|uniref:Uncharacterized protein n=1 Tax=Clohesyomyces aquaticus TaxID=1231657 RepID=A0A1Y1YJG7_9PLEO|nr:hypothetical protein BCR34DRAFT_607157 [Clohesyomyces aquaticus]